MNENKKFRAICALKNQKLHPRPQLLLLASVQQQHQQQQPLHPFSQKIPLLVMLHLIKLVKANMN